MIVLIVFQFPIKCSFVEIAALPWIDICNRARYTKYYFLGETLEDGLFRDIQRRDRGHDDPRLCWDLLHKPLLRHLHQQVKRRKPHVPLSHR